RDEPRPATRALVATPARARDHDGHDDRDRHEPGGQRSRRGLVKAQPWGFSVPMPPISTSSTSPATSGPTPSGVPVRITSPGARGIMRVPGGFRRGPAEI